MCKSMMGSFCYLLVLSVAANGQSSASRSRSFLPCRPQTFVQCPPVFSQQACHIRRQANCEMRSVKRNTCLPNGQTAVLQQCNLAPAPCIQGFVSLAPNTIVGGCPYSAPVQLSSNSPCPCQLGAPVVSAMGMRSPFSLSAQLAPENPGDPAIMTPCERMFLDCCASGMQGCFSAYISCSIALGEPFRHIGCP